MAITTTLLGPLGGGGGAKSTLLSQTVTKGGTYQLDTLTLTQTSYVAAAVYSMDSASFGAVGASRLSFVNTSGQTAGQSIGAFASNSTPGYDDPVSVADVLPAGTYEIRLETPTISPITQTLKELIVLVAPYTE